MALFGRATTDDSPSDVFAAPGDYVWGTGLKSINHAPILIDSENVLFLNNNLSNTIYLDSKPLSVYSVGDLISLNNGSNPNTGLSPIMGDLDRDTLGIAITNVDNTNGEWQFSNDNGTSWFSSKIDLVNSQTNYSDDFARLLGPKILLRFVPKQGYIGSSSFNFRLWDLTNQANRNDLSAFITDSVAQNGGDTPFSAVASTAKVGITNYAPVFDAAYLPQLPSISYKNTNASGISVDSLVPYGAIQDGTYNFVNSVGQVEYLTPDKAVKAIAVTSVDNSNGKWQFVATTGNNWQDFGDVTENNARLLNPDYKIRFVPNEGYIGNSSFTFRAWDQTNGNAGEIFDATANGGTTPFSSETRTATITTTNAAPYIASYSEEPFLLRTISHNNSNDSSETVADLLPDIFYDEDETTKSIAVTQVDNSNGIWQYSFDNGEGWINIGTVSQAKALLLDSNHKIRFVPNLNFVGRSSFSFKAWDGSSGNAGLTADVTNNGGQTPFSFNTETVEFNITNAAPRFLESQTLISKLSSISNTNSSPLGNTIAEILPDNVIIDDDGNPQKAVAIVSADGSNGRWQYSLDYGDTWLDIASISTSTALLLDPDSKVRFIPNTGFIGTASLSFRAWDKIIGTAGQLIDTSSNGGNKAFSTEIQKAEITVKSIDSEGETIATALDTRLDAYKKGVVELVGSIGNNPSKSPEYDVDFYKIQLNRDDVLEVKLITTEINSNLNGSIWLYDSQGTKLAFSDNSTYFDEPFFTVSAPYTDTYYISVSASGNDPDSPFLEENRSEITATSGNYKIFLYTQGNTLNNTLTGSDQNDILKGGAGNDVLDGGIGSDRLLGSTGDDLYLVDSSRDVVVENGGEGKDTVQSSANHTLTANIEDLTLTGTANLSGTGNNLDNVITGNSGNNLLKGLGGNDTLIGSAGNDTLIGGIGNDILTGGEGADTFLFGSGAAFTPSGFGVDTITNFTEGADKITLSQTSFKVLTSAVGSHLKAAEFATINAALANEVSLAGASSAKIVYNSTTGNLLYNQNGAAANLGNGGLFATLSGTPILEANDFFVQA